MLRWAVRILDTIIVFYLCLIGYYYLFGGFDLQWPFHIYLVDLDKPLKILAAVLAARLLLAGAKYAAAERKRVFILLTLVFSPILTIATGEIFLRIVYIDGGAETSGGPGGKYFVRTLTPDGSRFPSVKGPKRPDVTRIFIQGDSITYGNIREWTDLYPNLLLEKLNKTEKKYEMEVSSFSGREIDGHLTVLKYSINETWLNPDIIIYQWYLNDLELSKLNRPYKIAGFWKSLPWHDWLKKNSYLYYFLDNRLDTFVPWAGRSYIEYIREDFAENTVNWGRFRLIFHKWATLATGQGRRVILMIYPVVPFHGENPLRALYNSIKEICGPNLMSMPAVELPKRIGVDVDDKTSSFGKVRKAFVRDSEKGFLVFGPYIPLPKGEYTVTFRMELGNLTENRVANIDVAHDKGAKILASKEITGADFGKTNVWKDFSISFRLEDEITEDIEFRINYHGGADLTIDKIDIQTNYGIETLDLTPHLKDMYTAVSIFDGHPNEETYKVIADVLYKHIISK